MKQYSVSQLLLSFVLLGLAQTTAAGDLASGRLTALSGAGYTTGNHRDGALINPAAAGFYDPDTRFSLTGNLGARLAESDDFIDNVDELVDFIDLLQSLSLEDLEPSLADDAIDHLRSVEDKSARLRGDASLVLSFPNPVLSATVFYRTQGDLGAVALVDDNDFVLIENSINTPFSPDDLNSSMLIRGYEIREFGVALARDIPLGRNLKLVAGVTPKSVDLDNFVHSATVADFEEDDFDRAEYTRSHRHFNLDAGATLIHGKLHTSLSLRNLLSKSLDTAGEPTMNIKPQATAAVGYVEPLFSLEAALDLNAVPAFATDNDTQLLRLGAELTPLPWLQLRAGLLRELADSREDGFSLGVGFSPGKQFFLDLALISGDKNSLGGSVGLGAMF